MRKIYLILVLLLGTTLSFSQTTYYSKAAATDFNSTASWGTGTDGSGTAPSSITNTDNYVIQNSSAMTLTGSASVKNLTINAGSLSVGANTLTVAASGVNNSILAVTSGGTLTVTGGTVDVRGSVYFADGAGLTQSGGLITVDGNANGVTANSATGVIFGIGYSSSGGSSSISSTANVSKFSLTGGTIRIVDPTATSTSTNYAFAYRAGTGFDLAFGTGHTVEFGDGVSTDAGGYTGGFYCYLFVGTGYLSWGNVTVNAGNGTNRFVSTTSSIGILGKLTVNANSEYRVSSTTYITGNIVNNGTLTNTSGNTLNFATWTAGTSSVAPNAQSVSGSGTFQNATSGSTANFSSITVNNTSASGVTFANSNSLLSGSNTGTVSGTLTITAGTINIGANEFILGVSTSTTGTLTYNSTPTGGFAVSTGGKVSRWVATTFTGSVANTTYTGLFPFVVTETGDIRLVYLSKTSGTMTTGGKITMSYDNTTGTTSYGASFADGTLTPNVDVRTNAGWTITGTGGLNLGTSVFSMKVRATNMGTVSDYAKLTVGLSGGIASGTYSAGTGSNTSPEINRTSISAAGILNTFYLAAPSSANSLASPFVSLGSGNWNLAGTWSTNSIPTSSSIVIIASGPNVTLDASGSCHGITIASGGTLTVNANTLDVGTSASCTRVFTVNGTLALGGTGTINHFGNIVLNSSATYNQSGTSNLNIDGNGNNVAGNSVATGTHIFTITTSNFTMTGGTITIVDPHQASGSNYAIQFNATSNVNITSSSATFKFGNGSSTESSANTSGFLVNQSSAKLIFPNVIIDATASGTNRHVTLTNSATVGITGNLTITSGELRLSSSTVLKGNLDASGGVLSHTAGTLTFGDPNNSVSSPIAATVSQTITGAAANFRNSTTAETADFNSITINNSSSNGVVVSGDGLTMGGTLTFTSGKLNIGANTFSLGSSTTTTGTMASATVSNGSGIVLSTGKFRRWYATSTLSTSAANATGCFPIINGSTGDVKAVWLQRGGSAFTAGGSVDIGYNEVAGTSDLTAFADGAVNVDRRTNSNWTITGGGGLDVGTSNLSMRIESDNLGLITSVAGLRLVGASAALAGSAGTNSGTTSAPVIERTGISNSSLPLTIYIGADKSVNPMSSPITWTGGAGTNNWGDNGNWSGGQVPGSSDFVSLTAGSPTTININVSPTIYALTLGSNITLNLTSNTLTTTAFTQTGGTINLGSGTLDVKGDFTKSAGTFTASTGTVSLTGTVAQAFSSTGGITLNNFTLSGSGGNKTFTSGQTTTISGNLSVASSAVIDLSSASATTWSVAGNLAYDATSGGTNIGNLTLNLTGTNKTISGSGTASPNIKLPAGDSILLANNFTIPTGRSFTVDGGVFNPLNFQLSGGGSFSLYSSSGGKVYIVGANGFSDNIAVTGTITGASFSSAGTNGTSGIVNYCGSSQTIDVTKHPTGAMIHCSGTGTKTLSNNYTLVANSGSSSSQGALYVYAGATFNDGGYTLSLDGYYSNLVIESVFSSAGGGITFLTNPTGSRMRIANGVSFGSLAINFGSSTAAISLEALSSNSTSNITFSNISFGGVGGGLLTLNSVGITNVIVTNNLSISPSTTSNTGGGFGGTASTTGTVKVRGNITTTSTNTTQPIFNSTGTNSLILDGSSGAQTITIGGGIATTILTGVTLQIENTTGLNLGSGMILGGTLNVVNGTLTTGANNFTLGTSATATFQVGTTLNINGGTTNFAGKSVTFKSNASGSARIAQITGTLSAAGNTNVTVERYIPARKAWRLLGAPFTGTGPSVSSSWKSNTHITNAAGTTTTGFDASSISNGIASIFYFDGTNLVAPSDLTSTLITQNGGAYYLYIRGDRTAALLTNASTPATVTTLSATGTVGAGDGIVVGKAGTGGYSLIPNPYPSNIDLEVVRGSNGNASTFYVWDANLSTIGGYRTITRDGSGNYTSTPSSGGGASTDGRYIESGQAFWVPGNTQYTFNENMKTASSSPSVFRTTSGTEQVTVNLSIKQSATDYLLADGVRAMFDASYSNAITPDDAVKMNNFAENLGISRSNQVLAVEMRNAITANDTIFLKLWNTGIKDYRFTVEPINFGAGLTAYLIDAFTNTSTPLSLTSATDYDFSITSVSASQQQNRFMIVFRPSAALPLNITSIKAYEKGRAIQVDWNVATETGVRNYEVEKSFDGRNFVPASLVNARENNNSSVNYSWLDNNPINGNNYYRVKTNTITGEIKYTSIVNVKLGKTDPGITVYPNPVKGNIVAIQLNNLEKGTYSLNIYNAAGQLIVSKQIQHAGGSASEQLILPESASGIYKLELKGDNLRQVQSIILQ